MSEWIPFAEQHPDPNHHPYIWVCYGEEESEEDRYIDIVSAQEDKYSRKGYYMSCVCGREIELPSTVKELFWQPAVMPEKPAATEE